MKAFPKATIVFNLMSVSQSICSTLGSYMQKVDVEIVLGFKRRAFSSHRWRLFRRSYSICCCLSSDQFVQVPGAAHVPRRRNLPLTWTWWTSAPRWLVPRWLLVKYRGTAKSVAGRRYRGAACKLKKESKDFVVMFSKSDPIGTRGNYMQNVDEEIVLGYTRHALSRQGLFVTDVNDRHQNNTVSGVLTHSGFLWRSSSISSTIVLRRDFVVMFSKSYLLNLCQTLQKQLSINNQLAMISSVPYYVKNEIRIIR